MKAYKLSQEQWHLPGIQHAGGRGSRTRRPRTGWLYSDFGARLTSLHDTLFKENKTKVNQTITNRTQSRKHSWKFPLFLLHNLMLVLLSLSLNLPFLCSPLLFYFFLSQSVYIPMLLSLYLLSLLSICLSPFLFAFCLLTPLEYKLHERSDLEHCVQTRSQTVLINKKCSYSNKSLNNQ